MADLIIIVGGSAAQKTEYAFRLATQAGEGIVICGDQYQLLDGWSIVSGASDALAYAQVWKELYQSMPGGGSPYTCEEYRKALGDLLLSHVPDNVTAIVDSMSVEYLNGLKHAVMLSNRPISVIGIECPPVAVLKERMVKRIEKMLMLGLVPEVIAGVEKYGRDCWMAQNSLIVKNVLKVIDGGLGSVSFGALLDEAVQLASLDKRTALSGFPNIKWIAA